MAAQGAFIGGAQSTPVAASDLSGTSWVTILNRLLTDFANPRGRRVRQFTGGTVYNLDSVAATVELRLSDGTNHFVQRSDQLEPGETLVYEESYDLGQTLRVQIRLTGAVTTTNLNYTANGTDFGRTV